MTADELAALASAAYGSEWQSALARDRGVAIRTVQRWRAEGISKPQTASAIRAYLLSRRVVSLPAPDGHADRDDAAADACAALLDTICAAALQLGWHEAEILTGVLVSVADRMIAGAGPAAAADMLAQVRTAVVKAIPK